MFIVFAILLGGIDPLFFTVKSVHKKVLLCERKRHIAYQVLHLLSYSGVPYPWSGVPHPWSGYPPVWTWLGYPPVWTWPGYPSSGSGWGTPQEGAWNQSLRYPPERTWDQLKYYEMEMGTPRKDMGPVEVLWDGEGVLPSPVWTNKQTETITFPHPSEAGGKNRYILL